MPGPPALINSLPIAIRIGVARSTCSAVPPASSNRVPVMAFAEVRPTGTSIMLKPLACISAINLSVCSGWMVDISMTSASVDKLSQTPFSPNNTLRTRSPFGNMVMINSASFAACAGLAAGVAPLSTRCRTASAFTSKTRSWCPCCNKLLAIGEPICPKPINAIAAITFS